MSFAILAEQLHVKYRSRKGAWVHAVSGLSFAVEPGEVVGFLGPNGAGKSTTIKALMGFVQPSGGKCEVFGLPSGSIQAKSRIGYLPELALYYPFLTPIETLTLYGELQGLHGAALRSQVRELLTTVGLGESMTKQNRSLSKGMLQRVGIAQSLLGTPELLILDEVTSGLDPVGRKELRALLRERQKHGCTLFFSSHELSEVELLCDRILIVHKGKLIEERQIDALKNELRQYVLTYRGAVPMMDLAADWTEMEERELFRASFADKGRMLQAIARVHEHGSAVVDVVAQEGSLEDYFVDTIGRAA
jgi:ABC-2 type transport system ATP-binding protein